MTDTVMYRCEIRDETGEWVYATSYKTQRGAVRWIESLLDGVTARIRKVPA